MRIVFVITSTVNPSRESLSYTAVRSVFSETERFEQSLATIESIQKKAAGASVLYLENSHLSGDQEKALVARCDWLVSFAGDPQAVALRDGPNKGLAEVYMLRQVLDLLSHFSYEKLFKLSARYTLSDAFDLKAFVPNKISCRKAEGSVSTRLYAVPKTLERLYAVQLENTFEKCSPRTAIERLLFKDTDSSHLHLIDPLGVRGLVSVNGVLIDE